MNALRCICVWAIATLLIAGLRGCRNTSNASAGMTSAGNSQDRPLEINCARRFHAIQPS
jgi:hypothetical protein